MTPAQPSQAAGFPRYRPVGEHALLVEFGDVIDRGIHERVVELDAALSAEPFDGFLEAVPAYSSILVCFDPRVTDHASVEAEVVRCLGRGPRRAAAPALREVEICYHSDFAPDLEEVAKATGLTTDAVIAAHLAGDYSVFLYGFAPGYAYLAGVPSPIRLPRKQAAVRDIPAGAVLIAGPQCLVTTLVMPTGWWIIGRSPTRILDTANEERPFLFDVGDRVRFRRIDRVTHQAREGLARP